MTDARKSSPGATDASARDGRVRSCPVCGKPVVATYRPFCSRRCADLDLGRWLKGGYSIPAVEPPDGYDENETVPPVPGAGRDKDGA